MSHRRPLDALAGFWQGAKVGVVQVTAPDSIEAAATELWRAKDHAGVWDRWRDLEAAAREAITAGVEPDGLVDLLAAAGHQFDGTDLAGWRNTIVERTLGSKHGFVDDCVWGVSGGVRRGEAFGVYELKDSGHLERVLVELRPADGDPSGVQGCFEPYPDAAGEVQQSLEMGVAAGLGWVGRHLAWALPEQVGSDPAAWQVRVYLGGYCWPGPASTVPSFVVTSREGQLAGPSLGLAVALATTAAFLPRWASAARRSNVYVTGAISRDGQVEAVGSIPEKSDLALWLQDDTLLLPKDNKQAVKKALRQIGDPQLRKQLHLVDHLDDAVDHLFPLLGPLQPDQALAEPLSLAADLVPGLDMAGWLDSLRELDPVSVSVSGAAPQPLLDGLCEAFEPDTADGRDPVVELVGAGGTGKTTALTWLFDHAYRGQLAAPLDLVPVYLDAAGKDNHHAPSLANQDRHKEAIAERLGVEVTEAQDIAATVGLLVLIDATNEADPDLLFDRQGPLHKLTTWLTNHGTRSRIVVAGRPQPHERLLIHDPSETWHQLEVRPLDRTTAAHLLRQWSTPDDGRVEPLLDAVGELARTPLILRLLARMLQAPTDDEPLPDHPTRAVIYRWTIESWIRHDRARKAWQIPTGGLWDAWIQGAKWLDQSREDAIFQFAQHTIGVIAAWSVESGGELRKQEAIDIVGQEIATGLLTSPAEPPTSGDIVERLLANHPLVRWSDTNVTFLHHSIAEYYAAERLLAAGQLAPLSSRWVDVLALQAALDPDALGKLAAKLTSPDDCEVAAPVLARSEHPAALTALTQALSNPDNKPNVRVAAALALKGTKDAPALKALTGALSSDPESRVRRAAAEALAGTEDAAALEALTAALSERVSDGVIQHVEVAMGGVLVRGRAVGS